MPEACLKRPFAPNRQCQMTLADVQSHQASYHALLLRLKAAHPKLELFDSTVYLCDKQTCYVREGDRFIYRDSHHLSLYGSQLLAKPFLAWLNTEDKSSDHTKSIGSG